MIQTWVQVGRFHSVKADYHNKKTVFCSHQSFLFKGVLLVSPVALTKILLSPLLSLQFVPPRSVKEWYYIICTFCSLASFNQEDDILIHPHNSISIISYSLFLGRILLQTLWSTHLLVGGHLSAPILVIRIIKTINMFL